MNSDNSGFQWPILVFLTHRTSISKVWHLVCGGNLPWWYVTLSKIMFYGFSQDPKRRFLAFWHMQNMKTMKMAWAIGLIPHLVYPNLLNNSYLALWDRIPTSNHRSDHRNFEFEQTSIFLAASAIPVHEKWGYQCGIISKPFLKVTLRYLDIFKHRGKYSPAKAQKVPLFWVEGRKNSNFL